MGDQQAEAQWVTVSIVIDGDKIVLSDGRKIVLIGIDAPEKHPSAKLSQDAILMGRSEEEVIQQGKLAAQYLAHIAGGFSVRVKSIGKVNGAGYLPSLVYVTGEGGRPQYCLNQRMVAEGYAIADFTYNSIETKRYTVLEKHARNSKLGLWATVSIFVKPQETQSQTSETIVSSGNCARDSACVWVSAGGIQSGVGMWNSKPGRTCACAIK